jgi:tetratricopeptide (TPR) repeat protein
MTGAVDTGPATTPQTTESQVARSQTNVFQTNEAGKLVAEGERALYVAGDLAGARSVFFTAYELAEKAGSPRLLAEAAIGLGGLWVHEHRPAGDGAKVEAYQRAALAVQEPGSAAALRLRARLAAEADYRRGGHAEIMPVLDETRRAGDPVALSEALSLAHHCLLGPEHAQRRLELAEELMREGSRTGRPSDALMGLLWRTADLFLLGDTHAERSFAELCGPGQADANAAVGFVASSMRVMLAIRSGRLAEAERLAGQAAERGRRAGDADDLGWYVGQLATIRWYQGRIGEALAPLTELANSPLLSETDNAFLPTLAVAAATAGDTRTARGALARVGGENLAKLPRSSTWLIAMNSVAEAACLLDDADTAEAAYDLLLPYARLPMMGSLGVTCVGSVQHSLGVASLAAGAHVRAIEHFRAAVVRNTALGHWPAAALSRHRLGRALARHGDVRSARTEFALAADEAAGMDMRLPTEAGPVAPPARSGAATCTRYGRRWRVELGGRSAIVDDAVGIRYLATLIANPGVEVPALDLAEPSGEKTGPAPQRMLDDEALRQYRERLTELRSDIEEAEAGNDFERAARLRAEIDWLAGEIGAATGLGGRARRFADNPERARVAVGKAIRRALDRIAEADPVLGGQLRVAVQTGMRCCYRPVGG